MMRRPLSTSLLPGARWRPVPRSGALEGTTSAVEHVALRQLATEQEFSRTFVCFPGSAAPGGQQELYLPGYGTLNFLKIVCSGSSSALPGEVLLVGQSGNKKAVRFKGTRVFGSTLRVGGGQN